MRQIATTLGERIRNLRESLGESYEQFHIRLRGKETVSKITNKEDYVRKLESDKQQPSMEVLIVLCIICDWDTQYLLTGKKAIKNNNEIRKPLGIGLTFKSPFARNIMKNLNNCVSSIRELDHAATDNILALEKEANNLRTLTAQGAFQR